MHTTHPYWLLTAISFGMLTVFGSAGLFFWAAQKREDWLWTRESRRADRLENEHRALHRQEATR